MFTYDARGNLESRTDRSGSSSTRVFYEYDGIDRITRISYPAVNGYTPEETYEYDLYDSVVKCFVSRHTDINGVVTETRSDEAGNMRETKINWDVVEERDYDGMDRVVKVTDARGNSTSYYYDGLGRKWAVEYHWVSPESDFANPSEIYRYRADGKLESVTDGDDHAMGYTYDDLGRLIRKDYNDGSYLAYEYVGEGELVSKITDSKDGKEISYTYDTLRRVSQTAPRGTGMRFNTPIPVWIRYRWRNREVCFITVTSIMMTAR